MAGTVTAQPVMIMIITDLYRSVRVQALPADIHSLHSLSHPTLHEGSSSMPSVYAHGASTDSEIYSHRHGAYISPYTIVYYMLGESNKG